MVGLIEQALIPFYQTNFEGLAADLNVDLGMLILFGKVISDRALISNVLATTRFL